MAYDERALRGVGGWLAFLVLTLAVFSPLRGAFNLLTVLNAPAPPAYAAGWGAVRALTVVEVVIQIGIAWFLAWRLVHRQDRATVRIVMLGLWANALIVSPAMLLLVATAGGLPLGPVPAASGRVLARGVVYALVWTLYLQRSRRVANTYTDGDEGELRAVFE